MHLEATQTFIKLYQAVPDEIKIRAKKALNLPQENPTHPSLGHKKMGGQRDLYELRVSKNYRITYQKVKGIAYLRKIGTHNILNTP